MTAVPPLLPTEHPLRRQLAAEVHARPHERLTAPLRLSHVAMLTGEGGEAADRAHLEALCARHGVTPPPGSYFAGTLGPLRLRWERHTEFTTWTLLREDAFAEPFAETALALAPADWLAALPGQMLVGLHLAMDTADRDTEAVRRLFDGHSLAGSAMLGRARAWTDFQLGSDGFGRVLVRDMGLTRGQAGRLVQRLVEIETYRMMALLAFPLARATATRLGEGERRLSELVAGISESDGTGGDRRLLDGLAALAGEVERVAAGTAYRFAAARAYHDLVRQRVQELREERLPEVQTIDEFMIRRHAPAMRTCEAVAARVDRLAEDIARAGSLLRTRVDIALEEQNADLLRSMDRRAQLQLRLQETVEGLSVVAISYYLLGLLGYAAKGAKGLGLPVNPDAVLLAGMPIVLGLVWLGVRRLRRAVTGH